MRSVILLCIFALSSNADSSYEKAIKYLNGEVGATIEERKKPRCPYEKCEGDITYKHIQKDTKTAYKILKEASLKDARAAHKAYNILKKQINYKNENYDEVLLKMLHKNYGLDARTYDYDMRYFLNLLIKSSHKKYRCESGYELYKAIENGYFSQVKDYSLMDEARENILQNCEKNSMQYILIKSTKVYL